MGLGAPAQAALRAALSAALRTDSALAEPLRSRLIPQNAVEYRVAAQVGDFTDVYASIHHAPAGGGAWREAGAIDIQMEVWLDGARMRAASLGPQRLSHASFRDSWWTVAQMLAP